MTERRYGNHTIALSNLEKPFFPDDDLTKGDLIDYYASVAKLILPHIRGRPLTLQRFPDGIKKSGFIQQSRPDHFPDWFTGLDVNHGGDTGHVAHMIADNRASLIYLADQGTVTLHRWLSRGEQLRRPDTLVFDLDPPGNNFEPVRQGAFWVANAMRALGMTPYVMTTGSKGLHVVAPLRPEADFDDIRALTEKMASQLADRYPDELTSEQRKDKRQGRLYLDIMRNAFGQTTVAPYAVRAKTGAPVATPLDWNELDNKAIGPRHYTLRNIAKRLANKSDPWRHMRRHAIKPGTLEKKLSAHVYSGAK
ncbi:MAG: ATP-dependent DNA ligase [Gammaproteobacteria bacterium]|nr:ATP-dependent DNA ligase [Gammaproteobacteria bacterium]|tara:strand:- start:2496 stop:3419 length:924 start_codon:yes stop_codon:yes gene_type:complete